MFNRPINRQSNNGAEEVMGFSSISFSSSSNVIESEKSYDDWLQKEISTGEIITDVARITHSSSFIVAKNVNSNSLVFPYKCLSLFYCFGWFLDTAIKLKAQILRRRKSSSFSLGTFSRKNAQLRLWYSENNHNAPLCV